MNFTFKIFPADRLILQKWVGEFTLSVILNSLKQCQSHISYNRDYNLITDFRKAKIKVSDDEVAELTKQIAKTKFLRNRIAVLLDDPKNTVIVMLYSTESQQQNIKLFSTLPGASNWMGFSEQIEKFDFF
jgi:hypothetical protein